MNLATFVQISDLHFGDVDPSTQEAVAPPLWASVPWLDGLLGHGRMALARLEKFMDGLPENPPPRLIVTGDLTTWGDPEQFETANEYLGGHLTPPKGYHVGLGVKDWLDLAIPGNHDHWPGAPIVFGQPTNGLTKYFPTLPYVREPIGLSSGHSIRFLGLDSDADVAPFGKERLLARGRFTSQLAALETMLPVKDHEEIRVLLLHHSLSLRHVLGMEKASHDALMEFLAEHGIAVVLTGHLHAPDLLIHDVTSLTGAKSKVLEGLCGTTTQKSTLPWTWRTALRQRPSRKRPPNSLIVHQVELHGSEILWRSHIHVQDPTGFVPAKRPMHPRPMILRRVFP